MAKSDKYLPPKCSFKVVGGHIETDGSVQGRISGTMMGGILGVSPWSTPFQVACTLLGLASKDISDKPSVIAGKILETPIITYAGEKFATAEYGLEGAMFVPADEMFEKREGDHDSWVSDFDDPVFAGHVDGIVMTPEGENYILEIKTSSNMDSWVEGVPEYYYWQVALYNSFMANKDTAYVVLGIMDTDSVKDPLCWIPDEENCAMFKMDIDQENVEAVKAQMRAWYANYILKGVTPDYDPNNAGDVALYTHLVSLTESEDVIKGLVDELASIRAKIAKHEDAIKGDYDAEEAIKSKIKDYMEAHGIESMNSESGSYFAVVNQSVRKSIDPALMTEAGIDPEPFTVTKVSKTFTIKNRRD